MFDIWIGDINLTVLVIVFTVLIWFPLQLLLCCKAKTLWIRLIPVGLILLFALLSCVLFLAVKGWESLVFLFFLIYAAILLTASGLAWLLWALLKHRKTQ